MTRMVVLAIMFLPSASQAETALQWRTGTVERPGLKLGKPIERPYMLDFRYSPPDWQTSICLPDDWQKTLVGRDGAMLYDFPGEFAGFGTRVSLSLDGSPAEWIAQQLEDPRTPVVTTRFQADNIEMTMQAFAVPDISAWPGAPTQDFRRTLPRGIEPIGKHGPVAGWARPNRHSDSAFSDVDVGWNSSLRYRFRAGEGVQTVAFGLCEGHWKEAGHRILDLMIEGQTRQTVDPIEAAGWNVPFVVMVPAEDRTNDGWIDVEVAAAEAAPDKNTILNVLWVFDSPPDVDDVIRGSATPHARGYLPCGEPAAPPGPSGPPRADLMVATFANKASSEKQVRPMLRVQSTRGIRFDAKTLTVWIGHRPMIRVPDGSIAAASGDRELLVVPPPFTLAPDQSRRIIIPFHRNADAIFWSQNDADRALNAARTFWRGADLPYDHLIVPDAAVQALLDSCVRNIYQAREIKDGLPAFQVGPTCYRGLWIVDGAFLLEAVTLLNRPAETRAGVQYMLRHQNENGSFELMDKYWKETGIVLWVVDRHEQLTGDRRWLEQTWPRVEKAVRFIQSLRERASQDPAALHAGLVPPGFPDGGLIGPISEYTNVYWVLLGLKSAVSMARRTGRTDQTEVWQREHDDMWSAFRKAAERDLYNDAHGNRMLPIPMERPLDKAPHKALWAFCHAIYPGELFAPDDPLMLGTLASLTDNECEGLVKGTGWLDAGIWNYFGSFYGHAFAWLGRGGKAAQVLYAFGNHASPLLAWREEQSPKGAGTEICGDMPHNWASAEFLRLALHLLVFERGDELHLLEGLPEAWLRPGSQTAVRDVLTRFGPFSMRLRVAQDGRTAALDLAAPRRSPPRRIVLHTSDWCKTVQSNGQELTEQIEVALGPDPLSLTLTLNHR